MRTKQTEAHPLRKASTREYLIALQSGFAAWDFKLLEKTYVGSQGWKDFHRDMVKSIRKKYPKSR